MYVCMYVHICAYIKYVCMYATCVCALCIYMIPFSQGINSLELAMDAATSIQKKFYDAYPPHASEPEYKFEVPSTMKPTITQVRA